MSTIYVYVLDTLADWELGHVTSELNSGRFSNRGHSACHLRQSVIQKSQSLQWEV